MKNILSTLLTSSSKKASSYERRRKQIFHNLQIFSLPFSKKKEYQPKRFQIFCPRVMFLLNQV